MRGFAVLVVVLFHAEFDFVPSGFIGVDIFFVISGYLILGSLIRQSVAGTLTLTDFWARRIRRLIPAATVATVFILIGGWFLYPNDQLEILARDSIAAATYFANWNFILNQVSYWDVTLVSPFLHYWSLSVEEQFYIFFPLFFGLLLYSARRLKFEIKLFHFKVILGSFSLISFAALLIATADDSNLYFNTLFRLWEFGIGGLAAFMSLHVTQRVQILKWASLLGMSVLALIPNYFQYPGLATLLPVGLAAGYLALPDFAQTSKATRNLLVLGLHRLGDYSYSIYLWHWPIILYLTYFSYGVVASPERLDTAQRVYVVLASVFIGWLSYLYIEQPFRKKSVAAIYRKKWISFGAVSLALSVSLGFTSMAVTVPKITQPPSLDLNQKLTPEADVYVSDLQAAINGLSKPQLKPASSILNIEPNLENLLKSKAALYEDNCHLEAGESDLQIECVYGNQNSMKSLYLIGDSHAATWFPPINQVGADLGFKLLPRTKSSCGLFEIEMPRDGVETSEDCFAYRDNVIAEIKASNPDLVVVAQLFNNPGTEVESDVQRIQMNQDYYESIKTQIHNYELSEVPFLFVVDIPQLSFDPKICLENHKTSQCKSSRLAYLAPSEFLTRLVKENANFQYVNMNDFICDTIYCSATNDEFIIYRDRHHLTEAFSLSLSYVWKELLLRLI